jgi:hypothetical protein
LGASMAGLSIMILVVSSLATGSTRHEVYRTSSGRTYGRIGIKRLVILNTLILIIMHLMFHFIIYIFIRINFLFSVYHIHWHYLLLTRLLVNRLCLQRYNVNGV